MAKKATAAKPSSKAFKKGDATQKGTGKPTAVNLGKKSGDVVGMTLVPFVKKGALSVDVGPRVIASMSKIDEERRQLEQQIEAIGTKRYDLLRDTTEAIVKAAKADNSIDLSVAFGDDKKAKSRLNDQIGLALGFREVIETVDDAGVKHVRVATAKAVGAYFPLPTDKKDTAEYKRKETCRSNFSHMLTKCIQAASAIIDKKIIYKADKKSGSLMISGPAVKQAFGADSVVLNEKKIVGEGADAVELAQKPSFTALAALGAAEHGATIHRGSNTRGTLGAGANNQANKPLSPGDAVIAICKSLIAAIEKLPEDIDDKVGDAMEKAFSALDTALHGDAE